MQWACPRCTLLNNCLLVECELCAAPRSDLDASCSKPIDIADDPEEGNIYLSPAAQSSSSTAWPGAHTVGTPSGSSKDFKMPSQRRKRWIKDFVRKEEHLLNKEVPDRGEPKFRLSSRGKASTTKVWLKCDDCPHRYTTTLERFNALRGIRFCCADVKYECKRPSKKAHQVSEKRKASAGRTNGSSAKEPRKSMAHIKEPNLIALGAAPPPALPNFGGALGRRTCEDEPSRDDFRKSLCEQCGLSMSDFAPKFDCKYSKEDECKSRGSEQYFVPSHGWCKLGLEVSGKYNDTEWLQKRQWPVVYHGTSAARGAVYNIIQEGFKVRGGREKAKHGERLGSGIYCSPIIEKAMQYADVPLEVAGRKYAIVFQCRVKPKEYEKAERDIWRVNDPSDIRPCGILLHRFLLEDDQRIQYDQRNPFVQGGRSWVRYEQVKGARTIAEARRLGRSFTGLNKDVINGRLRLLSNESNDPEARQNLGATAAKLRERLRKRKLELHTPSSTATSSHSKRAKIVQSNFGETANVPNVSVVAKKKEGCDGEVGKPKCEGTSKRYNDGSNLPPLPPKGRNKGLVPKGEGKGKTLVSDHDKTMNGWAQGGNAMIHGPPFGMMMPPLGMPSFGGVSVDMQPSVMLPMGMRLGPPFGMMVPPGISPPGGMSGMSPQTATPTGMICGPPPSIMMVPPGW